LSSNPSTTGKKNKRQDQTMETLKEEFKKYRNSEKNNMEILKITAQ
jgi:hypothetical protein